jgi:hypothetical protein
MPVLSDIGGIVPVGYWRPGPHASEPMGTTDLPGGASPAVSRVGLGLGFDLKLEEGRDADGQRQADALRKKRRIVRVMVRRMRASSMRMLLDTVMINVS